MAKLVKQLSIAQINGAKPKDKVYYLMDGQGLKLAIKPNGTKTWLFNYKRPITQKRTEKTIGTYPLTSLKEARDKAIEYRKLLEQHIDPLAFEEEKRQALQREQQNTFRQVATEWLVYREKIGEEQKNYSEKTKENTERRVKDAIEIIGDIPFKSLTLQHGLSILEKHRQSGAIPELKKRYFILKAIAEYAERFGYLEKNQWRFLGEDLPAVDKTKHHPAIHYKALPEFLLSLRRTNISYTSLLAILWGLLNVTRASETVTAQFTDITKNEELPNELVWQVTVTKGGKGERTHLVPLSRQAKVLLTHIKKHSHKAYLFPSTKQNGQHLNAQTPNDIFKHMDGGIYKGVMTNHGIRTLFSSYCNDNRIELGLDKEIIEICLSHLNDDEVRNAYNRAEYLPYRLKTFQAWADYVEKCAQNLFREIIGDKS